MQDLSEDVKGRLGSTYDDEDESLHMNGGNN